MGIELTLVGVDGETSIVFGGDARGAVRARPDIARDIAARIGDEVPAAIRDRCYSLVQSIANWNGDDALYSAETWEDEAYRIAKDAGWNK